MIRYLLQFKQNAFVCQASLHYHVYHVSRSPIFFFKRFYFCFKMLCIIFSAFLFKCGIYRNIIFIYFSFSKFKMIFFFVNYTLNYLLYNFFYLLYIFIMKTNLLSVILLIKDINQQET